MSKLHTLLPSLIIAFSFLAAPVVGAAEEISFDNAEYENDEDCLYNRLADKERLNKPDLVLAAKQYVAKRKYDKQHTYITSEDDWKIFSATYLQPQAIGSYIDELKKRRDVEADDELAKYAKKLTASLTCDFNNEQLLILFAGPKISVKDLLDVAAFQHENRLHFFAFHSGIGFKLQKSENAENGGFIGTYYITKIPKHIGQLNPEFKIAYEKYLGDKACAGYYTVTAPAKTTKPTPDIDDDRNAPTTSRDGITPPENNG